MSDYQIIKISNEDGSEGFNLRGCWSPEILDILNGTSFNELRLHIDIPDFAVLGSLVEKITRLVLDTPDTSSTGLENFILLEDLILDSSTARSFNLPKFNKLKKATVLWYKKYSKDFFESPNLSELRLRCFDEQNCEKIAISPSIEKLELLESKISNLGGLQKIQELKSLTVVYCRKLEDVNELSALTSLTSLHIESCPKINNLDALTKLNQLERLHIEKVKTSFDNLDWVRELKHLKYVLNEAEVNSIDWYAVFGNKSVKEFATRTHSGYMITDDELVLMANKSGRKIKVIERFPPKKTPMISIEFDS